MRRVERARMIRLVMLSSWTMIWVCLFVAWVNEIGLSEDNASTPKPATTEAKTPANEESQETSLKKELESKEEEIKRLVSQNQDCEKEVANCEMRVTLSCIPSVFKWSSWQRRRAKRMRV